MWGSLLHARVATAAWRMRAAVTYAIFVRFYSHGPFSICMFHIVVEKPVCLTLSLFIPLTNLHV